MGEGGRVAWYQSVREGERGKRLAGGKAPLGEKAEEEEERQNLPPPPPDKELLPNNAAAFSRSALSIASFSLSFLSCGVSFLFYYLTIS